MVDPTKIGRVEAIATVLAAAVLNYAQAQNTHRQDPDPVTGSMLSPEMLAELRAILEDAGIRTRPMRRDLEPLAYSIEEAAQVSSIGRTNLYRLIKEGRLKTTKIGKRTIIPASALRALIESGGET